MALGRMVKYHKHGARKAAKGTKVWINKVTKGRNRGRFCVLKKVAKPGRSAVKGVTLRSIWFYGCFGSKTKAEARANKLRGGKK